MSQIALELVSGDHSINRALGLRHVMVDHRSMKFSFVLGCTPSPGDMAVVAHAGGSVVGVLHFNIRSTRLTAMGTWVRRQNRNQGVGLAMWTVALRSSGARSVGVDVITDHGKTLVESLRTRFPDVRWRVHENADDLKILKKRTRRPCRAKT